MGGLKCILDFDEVNISALLVCDFLILRVVFQPLMHVIKSVFFSKFIGEADTESKQTVKVVGILVMCLFESKDRIQVLVRLLVKLTKQLPCLSILCVLLDLSLEAEHGLLHLSLLN